MQKSGTFQNNLEIARHVFLVAVPIGLTVGCAIAAYDYVVNTLLWEQFARHLSSAQLSLLPILGMLLTGAILKVFRVKSSSMADEVVFAYHSPHVGIHYGSAMPKLAASIATMGLGGSAGMEGASKWLGGTIASLAQGSFNRTVKLKWLHGKVETTLLAGASAGIAAIFRAPLTGAIMGIESPYKSDLAHDALIHSLVASAMSYATFTLFRSSTPYFPILFTYKLHFRDLAYCLPVGLLAGAASHGFLGTLNWIRNTVQRSTQFFILRYLIGGILLSALAFVSIAIVGEPATLQAGLPLANRLLNGHYSLDASFLILIGKLLATAITFGCGGVGGLFVPSATIGAALGACCDILFQPTHSGLFTLIGIAAFTGASYNSLLFSAVFVAEATGSPMLVVPSLIASSVAFLASAGISNSRFQIKRRAENKA